MSAIDSLAAKTWYEIPDSSMDEAGIEPEGILGNDPFVGVIYAWSGGCFDTRRNRLIIHGGGHEDSNDNSVYAFDLDTLTWARICDPGAGNPVSIHSYDGLEYMPSVDKMFRTSGSQYSSGSETHGNWAYDFATNTWDAQLPNTWDSDDWALQVTTAWDPVDSLVYMVGIYGHTFRSYNPATNTFTVRDQGGRDASLCCCGIIDPVARKYYMMGHSTSAYSYALPLGTRSTVEFTGGSAMTSQQYPGLAWDPVTQHIIGWAGGTSVYSLNSTTDTWTEITAAGGSPTPTSPYVSTVAGNCKGAFGRFNYCPSKNVFVWVASTATNVWVYRLSGSPFALPTVQDEKNTYTSWGWSSTSDQYPENISNPGGTYPISDPDIHGDTEGDDLWTNLWMSKRGGATFYNDPRTVGWARYFKDDYDQGIGSSPYTWNDDDLGSPGFGDHTYGWGLIDYYLHTGTTAYLTAAQNIATTVKTNFLDPYTVPGTSKWVQPFWYGGRKWGRILMLMTRLAGVDSDWIASRDKVIQIYTTAQSPADGTGWNTTQGMYFESLEQMQSTGYEDEYNAGIRISATWQAAIAMEGMYWAYLATGNDTLRTRLISMAAWIKLHGHDTSTNYAGSRFGVNLSTGVTWHEGYSSPSYTTSLVNSQVIAYKLTGDSAYYAYAKWLFNRGTKGVYDSESRTADDTTVAHFVDTTFDSSSGYRYFWLKSSELQYTYLLFGEVPPTDTPPTGAITLSVR